MVITDKQDYLNKAEELFTDTNTYKPILKDPTSRLKNKLAQALMNIKIAGGLSDFNYKRPYPTWTVNP